MPEVSWVSPYSLQATKEGTFNEVPVITLDAIEAWMKQCIDEGYVNISQCIDDVRAMKER